MLPFHVAQEAGLDLNEIKGTGPSGRIVRKEGTIRLSGPPSAP